MAGRINRVDAAAKMFGVGSKQHKAAIKKFGPSGGPSAQNVSLKNTSGTKKSVGGRKSSGGRASSQPRDRRGRWK